MIGNALSWGSSFIQKFRNSIFTGKANTHTQFFPSSHQISHGVADEPAFAITIAVRQSKKKKKKKTEVGEASDKILNIWTHAIF